MAILSKSKQLKKELSLFNIYTIATGTTIASGFFLLPGLAFSQAGPAMILSYLIAVIPVLPAIFSSSELATAMPRAGGVYFFLDRSMGPLMGTIGGIGTWLALILKTAFALVGIGAYMTLFLPNIPMLPLSLGFALLFGIINLAGAKKVGIFQSFLVVALLFLLSLFSGAGIFKIDIQHFSGFFSKGIQSVFATAGLVYVSYVGLSKIASVSEEVKDPEKNIPLAMFLALGTVILVYVFGTLVMVGVVPADRLQDNLTPVASAAEMLSGHGGAILMIIAAIFAFFSVANAGILSASRYPLAMSRDHLLPRFFRVLSEKKIPNVSISITVATILFILILFDPSKIAKLAGAFQLFLFSLISLAVIVMRESHLESYDPGFRSPLYPWMQIFGIISTLWLIFEMGWLPSLFTLGLIGLGVLWYLFYARQRVIRDGAIYHYFARLGQRRFEGLDTELRSILKEKGLRDQDPFDAVVASSGFIDLQKKISFKGIVEKASFHFSKKFDSNMDFLVKLFLEGTQVGATPVAHGAALPHLRLEGIQHSEMVMVRSKVGVQVDIESDFLGNRERNEPVYAFFFLISPEENPGQHLRILAQIASRVDDEGFIERWRTTKNEQEIKELLLRDDRYLSLLLSPELKTAPLINREIRDLDLPEGSLIALIHRNQQIIIPQGSTILLENDRLTIIGNPQGIEKLYLKYI
jgi:APA family basic amino acid/polyamine antiporter